MQTNTISAVELRSLLSDDHDLRLVDVRTGGEFETGHIAGSYHVPLDALREHRNEFRQVSADVVLVCQSGNRATEAAQRLGEAGLTNVRILEGGIARWIASGGDVNRGEERWGLERQVRLVAGSIVVASILASIVRPKARFAAGFVGGGLAFSALTNTCAMASVLSRLPYNRGSECDVRAVVQQLTDPRPVPVNSSEEGAA